MMSETPGPMVPVSYMRFVVSTAVTLWMLWIARDVLQPLVIGLLFWILLNAATRRYQALFRHIGIGSVAVAKSASALSFGVVVILLSLMIAANAAEIAGKIDVYENRLDALAESVTTTLGIEQNFGIADMLSRIEIGPALLDLAGSAAGFLSTVVVVLIYLIFISAEVGQAESKLAALVDDPDRRERIVALTHRVLLDVETYLGLKVVIGIVQAVPTWILLVAVGVDAALFWAMVVFVSSFIPTIGTLIGIVFPALMALLQFESIVPFVIVLGVLVPVQSLISNWLEPRMMSSSLNLSALAVIVGIFAGGALWGITGALIVVPLMAVVVIVFARIPSLRPVAVLISGDGRIDGIRSDGAKAD